MQDHSVSSTLVVYIMSPAEGMKRAKSSKMILNKSKDVEIEGVAKLVFQKIEKISLQILFVERYILSLVLSRNDVVQSSGK